MCSSCDAAESQPAVTVTGQPGHRGGTARGMGPGTGVLGAVVEAASRGPPARSVAEGAGSRPSCGAPNSSVLSDPPQGPPSSGGGGQQGLPVGPCVAGVDTVDVALALGSWGTCAAGEAGWATFLRGSSLWRGLRGSGRKTSDTAPHTGATCPVSLQSPGGRRFSTMGSCGPVVRV